MGRVESWQGRCDQRRPLLVGTKLARVARGDLFNEFGDRPDRRDSTGVTVHSEYREVTASSGRTYTLLAEAWYEGAQSGAVHLSVVGNHGRGLGLTASGPWVCLYPPELPTNCSDQTSPEQ